MREMYDGERGFSVVEVAVATSVLLIGILGVFALVRNSMYLSASATRATVATKLAQEGLEFLMEVPFLPLDEDRSIYLNDTALTDCAFVSATNAKEGLDFPCSFDALTTSLKDTQNINDLGSSDATQGPLMFRRSYALEEVKSGNEATAAPTDGSTWVHTGQVRIYLRVTFLDVSARRRGVTVIAQRTWDGVAP